MIEVAIKASEKAAEILRAGFGSAKADLLYKEDFSPVTKFDKEAESAIIKMIKESFPSHNILAEESGQNGLENNYTWIIDPLDGTGNFSRGIPFFAVGIALVKDKEIVCTVVNEPLSKRIFTAENGKGAFLNGAKIKVSEIDEIEKATVHFARGRTSSAKDRFKKIFSLVSPGIRSPRIFGSSVLELAEVANGASEGVVVYDANPWDVYSGVLLVREAGGKVTDFSGNQWKIGCKEFLITNGRVHDELLQFLKGI
jgi:myo-inositol-1(or 4)-monophosphatase